MPFEVVIGSRKFCGGKPVDDFCRFYSRDLDNLDELTDQCLNAMSDESRCSPIRTWGRDEREIDSIPDGTEYDTMYDFDFSWDPDLADIYEEMIEDIENELDT